jgi:hypothetical protein
MYYVIHLYTNYGCCANKAEAQLHIIFHSRTPMIVKPQLIQQPPNWYPQIMQKCVYQNMSLYVYNPDTRMPFVNLPSNNMMYQPSLETTHNQMNEDLNSNQQQGYPELMVNKNENWSLNHSYKPVFYDE